MKTKLVISPAPVEPGRSLLPARPRRQRDRPTIVASRSEILDELERRATESPRYADWPEQVSGVPVGFLPGHAGPLCYALDTHRIVIGKSGGGKGSAVIAPMLLHDDDHAVVLVDPKNGVTTRATAGYRQSLGPVHIVDPYNMTGFFDHHPCARYNPLDVLDPHGSTLVEDVANLANALCYLPEGDGDHNSFWDRSARSFTMALLLHLVTSPGETADLLRFWELLTMPGDEFVKQVVEPMQRNPACGGSVSRFGNAFLRHGIGNHKSFEDVFATIRSYVPWIEFQQIRAVTARTTFDFADVRERGGTIYIVMDDDRLDDCASWMRLILQSARLGLKRAVVQRPVHFIIDEAAALGKFDLITTGLRAWRSAKIRLHLIYQEIGQVKGSFKDGGNSIGNAEVLQFVGANPTDWETAEYISKTFGERDVIVPTVGGSASVTEGTSDSRARGRSLTETTGTSDNRSESVTRTLGSNWSTTIGTSRTVGMSSSSSSSSSTTSGSSTTYRQHGPQTTFSSSSTSSQSSTLSRSESDTVSRSDTKGKSESEARGETKGSGSSKSKGTGSSETDTEGSSRSTSTAENHTFTLQLRRSLRPEQVRMMSDDQMIVIASNCEPAFVHREHYFRNPRLVARALMRFDPTQAGPIAPLPPSNGKALVAPKPSIFGTLLSIAVAAITGRD